MENNNICRTREFTKFRYGSADEFKKDNEGSFFPVPFSQKTEALLGKVCIKGQTAPNSMGIHPMEGCDSLSDGSPGELTQRRYKRFAGGGAGFIWFEAVAVEEEGRAKPNQLWIHRDNLQNFIAMRELIEKESEMFHGQDRGAVCIMQLTHSGRYSNPYGDPAPVIAAHCPVLDERQKIPEDYPLITDERLEGLKDSYVKAALLAKKAGFDGVDIKACHRYLISELLSAHTRNGKYGGSFENRIRFLTDVIKLVREACGDSFIIGVRLNIYDSIPWPYGFCVDREDFRKPDFVECIKLARVLEREGVDIINTTMGNPYYNPHVNRPYNKGFYEPDEHPLDGEARLLYGAGLIQEAVGIPVMGTGFSWFNEYSANVAAGCIEQGLFKIAGFGRMAFAYPDFAKDITEKGNLQKEKCCIACSMCAGLLRAGKPAGCPARDRETYQPV